MSTTNNSPSPTTNVTERLALLRAAMRRHRIDAFIVPSSDPHLSEYLPTRWQGREWISGFTGSAGTFIATDTFAGVWTDGRYWTQAESELAGTGIALMQIRSGGSVQYIDWLAENIEPGQTVASDFRVLGLATARLLSETLAARGITLRTDIDLLDEVWSTRPALPSHPVFEHAPPYAHTPRSDKLAQARAEMARLGANAHFISTLDDIAYLFNLRGADVSFNPVFLVHALLRMESATLYVQAGKIPHDVRERLHIDGVELAPYEEAADALAALCAETTLQVDPRHITAGMRAAVGREAHVIEAVNSTTLAKSRKTVAEAAHVRITMEQDGAALCEFFA